MSVTFLPPATYNIRPANKGLANYDSNDVVYRITGGNIPNDLYIDASNASNLLSLSDGSYNFNFEYNSIREYSDPEGDTFWNVSNNDILPVCFFIDGSKNNVKVSSGTGGIQCSNLSKLNKQELYTTTFTEDFGCIVSPIVDASNIIGMALSSGFSGNHSLIVDLDYGQEPQFYIAPFYPSESIRDTYFFTSEETFGNINIPIFYNKNNSIFSNLDISNNLHNNWTDIVDVSYDLTMTTGAYNIITDADNAYIDCFMKNTKLDITGQFNSISLFDPAYGWARQGINMFSYKTPINDTDATGYASNTAIPPSTSGDMSGNIPLVPTNNVVDKHSLLAGRDVTIITNRSAFFTTQFQTTTISETTPGYIPVQFFPFTAHERSILNTSNITNVIVFNAVPVGPNMKTFDLGSVAANNGVYIHSPSNTDNGEDYNYKLKSGGSTITITVKGLGDGVTNQNHSTFTISDPNSAVSNILDEEKAVATINATFKVGASFVFANRTFVLGDAAADAAAAAAAAAAAGVSGLCFKIGTQILTPEGYKSVETLKVGDQVTTRKGATDIIDLNISVGKHDTRPLYCLSKNSLGSNLPLNDLYMSGDHAFKINGKWHHMSCAAEQGATTITDQDDIQYYHIVTSDYFSHTLNAEGVEVETCFIDKGDGILMLWSCENECCRPLKCVFATKEDVYNERKRLLQLEQQKKLQSSNFLLGSIKPMAEKGPTKKLLWAYNDKQKSKVPMVCTEIDL